MPRLVAALRDPARFGAACPVPRVALSHPEFSTDMWRGPAWINLNALIIRGLAARGCCEEAARLAEQTVALVGKYYARYGVLFEFYDSRDERPPCDCDRKGPRRGAYDFRVKYDSVRDYHWTAALVACLLWPGGAWLDPA